MCEDETYICISTPVGTYRMRKSDLWEGWNKCNKSYYCYAPRDRHEVDCIYNPNFKPRPRVEQIDTWEDEGGQ